MIKFMQTSNGENDDMNAEKYVLMTIPYNAEKPFTVLTNQI